MGFSRASGWVLPGAWLIRGWSLWRCRIAHAILSDPAAKYEDLGPGYYERRADTRRRARSHVRGLERLGYKVTIEAIDPGTGELTAPAS